MIEIAAYQGTSLISRIIRLLTYSKYSHIGMLFTESMTVTVDGGDEVFIPAGTLVEAWQGGVRFSPTLSAAHTRGTLVDLFLFKEPLNEREARALAVFLVRMKGRPYDYWNVLRFVPLVRLLCPKTADRVWDRKRVFCSELAMEACALAGRKLLERCAAWTVPPRDPPRSPLLRFSRTTVTH